MDVTSFTSKTDKCSQIIIIKKTSFIHFGVHLVI